MTFNVWNITAIHDYLRDAADGDDRLTALLTHALKRPLLVHAEALSPLTTLPPNPPAWLKEKFARGETLHHFNPAQDPTLSDKVIHVRDWIRGALERKERWTTHPVPQRLMHFNTLDDAYTAADEAMIALRVSFMQPAADPAKGTIIVQLFPDGYKLRRLLTPNAVNHERRELHHTVGDSLYEEDVCQVYSLRDALEKPLATLEVKNGIVVQCKGTHGGPPDEKAFPYLRDFIVSSNLGLEEDPGFTGLAYWEGSYHSLYSLPDNINLPRLDLTGLGKPLALPLGVKIGVLSLGVSRLQSGDRFGNVETLATLPPDATFNVISLVRKENNRPHNNTGPATINMTSIGVEELWFRHGKLHREDGPAIIKYDPGNGKMVAQTWCHHGVFHRDHAPAFIKYDSVTGNVIAEMWYQNGKLHREDGPAATRYHPVTQTVTDKVGYLNGLRTTKTLTPRDQGGQTLLPPSP